MDEEKEFRYFVCQFRRMFGKMEKIIPNRRRVKWNPLQHPTNRFLYAIVDLPNPVLSNYCVQIFGLPEMLHKKDPVLVEFSKMISSDFKMKIKDVKIVYQCKSVFLLLFDEDSQAMAMKKLENLKWRGYTIVPALTDFHVIFRIIYKRCLEYVEEKQETDIQTMLKNNYNIINDVFDAGTEIDANRSKQEQSETLGSIEKLGEIKESIEKECSSESSDLTNESSHALSFNDTTDKALEVADSTKTNHTKDLIVQYRSFDNQCDQESPYYLPNHVFRSLLPLWSIPHHQQLMMKQSLAELLLRQAWESVCNMRYPGDIFNPIKVWNDLNCQKLGRNIVYTVDGIRYSEKCDDLDVVFDIGFNIQTGRLDIGYEIKDGRIGFTTVASLCKVPKIHPTTFEIKKRLEPLILDGKCIKTNLWRQLGVSHNGKGEFVVSLKLFGNKLGEDKSEPAKKIADEVVSLLIRDRDLNVKNIYAYISSKDGGKTLDRIFGIEPLTTTVGNCRFLVVPGTSKVVERFGFMEMFKTVLELADVNEKTRVISFFKSSDYISLNLAKKCKSVAAIYMDQTYRNVWKENMALNEIKNCTIGTQTLAKEFETIFSNAEYNVDPVTVVMVTSWFYSKASIQKLRQKKNVTRIVLVLNSSDKQYTVRMLEPFSLYYPNHDAFLPRRIVPVDILPSSNRIEICLLLERVSHAELLENPSAVAVFSKPKLGKPEKPIKVKDKKKNKKNRSSETQQKIINSEALATRRLDGNTISQSISGSIPYTSTDSGQNSKVYDSRGPPRKRRYWKMNPRFTKNPEADYIPQKRMGLYFDNDRNEMFGGHRVEYTENYVDYAFEIDPSISQNMDHSSVRFGRKRHNESYQNKLFDKRRRNEPHRAGCGELPFYNTFKRPKQRLVGPKIFFPSSEYDNSYRYGQFGNQEPGKINQNNYYEDDYQAYLCSCYGQSGGASLRKPNGN